MAIDGRPARAAEQDYFPKNPQLWRAWGFDSATGPDVPEHPAHGTTWHADERPLLIAGSNFRNRRIQAAERAFSGDRGTGYRRDAL